MNAPVEPVWEKFAIGQPVRRKEDPVLLRGEGRYTDDIALPGHARAVLVRSPYAHGLLRGMDTEAARAMPGVLGIYTAADLAAAGIGAMPFGLTNPKNSDGSDAARPHQSALATDRVRYVGDPIALVVAETLSQARDAAESLMPDIDPLPAVTSAAAAVAPGAPQLYDGVPGNVAFDFHSGDRAAVAAAFAGAAHVTRLELDNSRIVVCPMEPRSATAEFDPAEDRWTLRVGSQGVFGLRGTV
ncbi:MAG: xanthine dehydrogenase family protein molybdopterin-binding subunit, partial [Janthinobacterium lividum]